MKKVTSFKVVARPVFLLHGMTSSSARMEPLGTYLRARGHDTVAMDFVPNCGELSLLEYARELDRFVTKTVGAEEIDIVAHSMGGVIAAAYLQILGGHQRTRSFISVAAPHNGTHAAFLWDSPGVLDMRPGSSLQQSLMASRGLLSSLKVTTIRAEEDIVIISSESSHLAGARNLVVDGIEHEELMSHRTVHDLIWRGLRVA